MPSHPALHPGFFPLISALVAVFAGCRGGNAPPNGSVPMPPAPLASEAGTTTDHTAVKTALRTGDAASIASAIDQAKLSRWTWLGCATAAHPTVTVAATPIDPAAVRAVWNAVHAPGLIAYDTTALHVGRDAATAALGAFYALRAGGTADAAALTAIADNLGDQQYGPRTSSAPARLTRGLFGYLYASPGDPWYRGGAIGERVAQLHAALPDLFVTYDRGRFAGREFAVADTRPASNFYDGGAAYDHGWAGVMMIEAALQLPDGQASDRCRIAALLAGEWAAAEPLVTNHNYVAKLVWLLAELYAWTGDQRWRDACLMRFRTCLAPAVLMDRDGDGLVDGVPGLRFSSLTAYAQRPGRMWDGHNALPWYGAMVATALVEAYVALRDGGDGAAAAEVRPYALAMLDNLAWEQGRWATVDPAAVGFSDVPFPLLLGLWKIARVEGLARPEWERACAALWNAGWRRGFGRFTANAGLYLVLANDAPYVPPPSRLAPRGRG